MAMIKTSNLEIDRSCRGVIATLDREQLCNFCDSRSYPYACTIPASINQKSDECCMKS